MHGAAEAVPELWLQIVERHFEFRECNYSLYPSWLAYPWPHAHLRIGGSGPFAIERCERGAYLPGRSDDGATAQVSTSYDEAGGADAVAAALSGFARIAPQPVKALLNINPGGLLRSVSGQLLVFGRRVASVSRDGRLQTLSGVAFDPPPQVRIAGAARGRVRGQILVQPDTRLEFALPAPLARMAQRRPRAGLQVERIAPLPTVFVEAAAFRILWPAEPFARAGQRYRLSFGGGPELPLPAPLELQQVSPATPVEAAVAAG